MTYGNFADGTARRLALAAGAEHISVLYNRRQHGRDPGLAERSDRPVRRRLPRSPRSPGWGCSISASSSWRWPLSFLLPQVAAAPLGTALGWPRLLAVAAIPALLTPLILWKLPTDFLPILLGDYLALHFATYGLLTFVAYRLLAVPTIRVGSHAVDYRKFARRGGGGRRPTAWPPSPSRPTGS